LIIKRSPHPILQADQTWEAGAELMAIAALADGQADQILLYYLVRPPHEPGRNVLCLATSPDGVKWSKPNLGDGTNIVMRGSGIGTTWGEFMPTTILREDREPDPAQRWKMVYWDRPDPRLPSGICLATSPDGRDWRPCHDFPIITNMNDAMSMIEGRMEHPTPVWRGNYYIYQQTWKFNPELPIDRDNLKGMHRRISIWFSGTFKENWLGPVTVLEPDAGDPPDLQFYWLVPFRTLSGGYGGLLNCHHTIDQTMDVQLVSSPDGWSWTRENGRRPLLPTGGPGQFDCGISYVQARPLAWKGKVLLFYNGRSHVHSGSPRFPGVPAPASGIGLAEFSSSLLRTGDPGVP